MQYQSPYASKVFGEKRLSGRTHGIKQVLSVGMNTITFNAVYEWAKVTCVEVVGCESLDTVSLKVYNAADVLLHQFSYSVNLPSGFYRRESKFELDFVLGMKIVLDYESVSAKTVGINIIMDELK